MKKCSHYEACIKNDIMVPQIKPSIHIGTVPSFEIYTLLLSVQKVSKNSPFKH